MAEVVTRLVDAELNRMPAANSYKLYYTALDPTMFGMDVCNGEGADAHISIFIVEGAVVWVDGAAPPTYTVIHKNQRIEADGIDGNTWVMPVKSLKPGDRVVVRTDLVGVTFLGHGLIFPG